MNTWRKLWLSIFATALVASVMPAQADVTWDQVKQKITSAKDSSVTYKYNGPNGIYDFDYRWGGPDHIRTEITNSKTDPSKKGTVIVYDKSWKADQVRAKTGGGVITRNLTHKDVQGRPFATSLFGMILDQTKSLGAPKASASGGGKIDRYELYVDGRRMDTTRVDGRIEWDSAAESVKTERKDGKSKEIREFLTHKWNTSPATGF